MLVSSAVVADVVCVVIFTVIGRSSHSEAANLTGVAHTAWPFLVGCLVGQALGRSWRQPVSLRTGVVVWLCTVAAGVLLRLGSGSTAQWSFVIVATVFLGLCLLGWRAFFRLVQRARCRRLDRGDLVAHRPAE